jgi:uncharacterized protein (TIGR01777 family)
MRNNNPLFFTMIFALIIRTSGRAAAFSSPRAGRSSSRLQVGFLENLQKSFSTMTNDKPSKSKYFTVGLTGSGGLIGTAFRDEVSKTGMINGKPARIVCLTRGAQAEEKELTDAAGETKLVWNPNADSPESVVDVKALQSMDAIIHLAGENISTGQGILGPLGIRPWTNEKKAEIINSRVVTTSALAKAIGALNKKTAFLVASGVGAYGPDFIGKDVTAADESSDISKSKGFLAEVSRQWEDASLEAMKNANCRVVNLRNGVVLSTKGGAMAKLYPIFFLGGGGIVGSGDQYFPFISARDMARAMIHVLENEKATKLQGPVNMCAPVSATNAEFTYAMGSVLKRPTILPLPGFAVSLLFGEMGEEVLLGGTRATPSKLLNSGFQFSHPTVEEAVQSAVDETI